MFFKSFHFEIEIFTEISSLDQVICPKLIKFRCLQELMPVDIHGITYWMLHISILVPGNCTTPECTTWRCLRKTHGNWLTMKVAQKVWIKDPNSKRFGGLNSVVFFSGIPSSQNVNIIGLKNSVIFNEGQGHEEETCCKVKLKLRHFKNEAQGKVSVVGPI